MKKTLIALAVAASAVVSGSAFAWNQDGVDKNITLGGTLEQKAELFVWESQVGADINNLDGKIVKGATSASIDVDNPLLVLSIRPVERKAFAGRQGIKPRIDYGGHVDFSNAVAGKGVLKLDITGKDGNVIGKATAPFTAAGWVSVVSNSRQGIESLSAPSVNSGFFGGLPASWERTAKQGAKSVIESLAPDAFSHFDPQGMNYNDTMLSHFSFDDSGSMFSAVYAGGILKGESINIELNKPATGGDAIVWKGVLPVVLSFS